MTPYTLGFYVESVPFGPGEIAGTKSLGGSESACLGLARALRQRGHDVHVFAAQLDQACTGPDQAGVVWHSADDLEMISRVVTWDLFTVLRMYPTLAMRHIPARLRWLWNQDLLHPEWQVMSVAHAFDDLVFVSRYHQQQWWHREPALKGLGWVTRNGYDPQYVPASAVKRPYRAIYVSRPERGLGPLLAMWPALKARIPEATLQVCRYSSMYDAGGWGKVCAAYDQQVADVNAEVGGIEFLGELGKAELYRRIAEAAVMWYPGVHDFAETSCIAAIEAQACGTPLVCSWKGALPETAPDAVCIRGDAMSPAYQAESVDAVERLMREQAKGGFWYRQLVKAGREHVKHDYAYAQIAEQWERAINEAFAARRESALPAIARELLHQDDHVAARVALVETLGEQDGETAKLIERCDRAISGEDHTAENYGDRAISDPVFEANVHRAEVGGRMMLALDRLKDCHRVADIAGGNGAFAILLATSRPDVRVTSIDFSPANTERAGLAATRAGVGDRCAFVCGPVWDMPGQAPGSVLGDLGGFDGLFCGEFLEHVADAPRLIEALEAMVVPGSPIVYTVPAGTLEDMVDPEVPMHRGHVHAFTREDLQALFGPKDQARIHYVAGGVSPRQEPVGTWVVSYVKAAVSKPAGSRDLATRILRTRPMQTLSVGIIAHNAADEIRKCLRSVWAIADEIVIGDCGSTDDTAAVAQAFGFGRKTRVVPLPRVADMPGGFSEARNRVLDACTSDWFLWIDTDEVLVNGGGLRKFLDSPVFDGYSLKQIHLAVDMDRTHDTPIRLFRRVPRGKPIRFYGCVHEQPQQGDCNGDVYPALAIEDVVIAHTGYLSEPVRNAKMLRRNLPLLERDAEMFPDRTLGKVLWVRDYVNLAEQWRKEGLGEDTVKAYLFKAVGLYRQHFSDPTHKYHELARPYYEAAVRALGGIEMELAMAGKAGGMGHQHAQVKRRWFADLAEVRAYVEAKLDEMEHRVEPVDLHPDPFEDEPVEPAVLAEVTP